MMAFACKKNDDQIKITKSKINGNWRVVEYIWGGVDVTEEYKTKCGLDLFLDYDEKCTWGNQCKHDYMSAYLNNDTLVVDGTLFVDKNDNVNYITFNFKDEDINTGASISPDMALGAFGVLKVGGGRILKFTRKELWFTHFFHEKEYTIKLEKISKKLNK